MKITSVYYHNEKEWLGFDKHRHNKEWQIDLFTKGSGKYLLNNYWLRVFSDTLFIVPPFNYHQVMLDYNTQAENFSVKIIFDNEEILKNLVKFAVRVKINDEKIKEYFRNIIGLFIIGKREKILEIILNQLIFRIIKNLEIRRCNLKEKIEMVQEIIEENYFQSNLKISFIADKVNLNPYYLCKKYKEITGKNMFKYIRELRLKKGFQMIVETDEPLKKIATISGFKNIYYFTNSFKRYYKITPGKLRKMNAKLLLRE